jgi:hypothetical protein
MEDVDSEYYDEEADQEDLESRVAELELAIEDRGSSRGFGCRAAFYRLGATLYVVISWETNHAVLWAVLHGFLSWLHVIYVIVAHSDRVKVL